MRASEVNRKIERLGGYALSQRGSHRRYEASTVLDGQTITARTTVARHPGDIPAGTLRAIERDMEPVFGKGWLR